MLCKCISSKSLHSYLEKSGEFVRITFIRLCKPTYAALLFFAGGFQIACASVNVAA